MHVLLIIDLLKVEPAKIHDIYRQQKKSGVKRDVTTLILTSRIVIRLLVKDIHRVVMQHIVALNPSFCHLSQVCPYVKCCALPCSLTEASAYNEQFSVSQGGSLILTEDCRNYSHNF